MTFEIGSPHEGKGAQSCLNVWTGKTGRERSGRKGRSEDHLTPHPPDESAREGRAFFRILKGPLSASEHPPMIPMGVRAS
jgi:hypothetical protein